MLHSALYQIKKGRRWKWLFVIISIGYFPLLESCNTLEGHRGISKNIEESKERKVYVANYATPTNPYSINDTLIVNVKCAWLEKRWHYTEKLGESRPDHGYRLIIITDSIFLNNYNDQWIIGLDYNRYFQVNPTYNLIHTEFDSLPANLEVFKVQKGINLKAEEKKIIIGQLSLNKISE